jgi:hypothetical protein
MAATGSRLHVVSCNIEIVELRKRLSFFRDFLPHKSIPDVPGQPLAREQSQNTGDS